MKVLKMLHLLHLMINLSKRRTTAVKNNTKTATIETGRENVKGKKREKKREKGNESVRGNANAREIESAVIREAELGVMIEKEAVVGIMAAERVIGDRQHHLLQKREEVEIVTEINIRGKMITQNFNCKEHLQT